LVAQRYGVCESQIYLHLKFLELPQEIQQMMIEGKLPTQAALALQRSRLKKRVKDDPEKERTRLMWIARELVAQLEKPGTHSDSAELSVESEKPGGTTTHPKKLTVQNVKDAARRALLEQGEQGQLEASQLEIHESILNIAGLSARFVSHAGRLIAPEVRATAIDGIRNLGVKTPPEVIRDRLQTIRASVDVLVQLVDEAILPPPLIIPPGRPLFRQHLDKFRPEAFGPGIRYLMVCELASASDNQGIAIPVRLMAERIGVNEKIIGSNIRFLREELQQFELELEEIVIRVKNNQGEYEKIPGYRLKWKTGSGPLPQTPSATTQTSALGSAKNLATPAKSSASLTPQTSRETVNFDPNKFQLLCENKLQKLAVDIAKIIARHPYFGTPKLSVRSLIDNRIIVSLKITGSGEYQKITVGCNIEGFDINFKVYLKAMGEAVKSFSATSSVRQIGLSSLTSRNQL